MINKLPPKRGREPWPRFNLLAIMLLGLALVSAVTLDYINREKGERSYLFARPESKPAAVSKVQPPPETAVRPSAPPARTEAKAKPEAARKEPTPRKAPRGEVALIIDDMGYSLDALDDILALGQPITISVLPYGPHARETAQLAHENSLEVLLHLPLESINDHEADADTEGMILSGMSPEEIVQSFETSLARVPFADGVNNHMGSKFTADTASMRALLAPIREKGLFFVDSRTTAHSVAYAEAIRMGIPAAERNVFLDADSDRRLIKSRLIELFKLAQKKGRAVGICHPFRETLEALKADFGLFENYGLEVVPVSRLARR
jgi:polysaccharide deacetylase 2 family uncharacterized protein YibQ